jgi:hypothetical protein
MELSPVDNYPRGTGPSVPERFRYEPVTFNYTSLSMHFDPLLAVFFRWLGEHQLLCPACAQPQIAYNCRNRHCTKCQAVPLSSGCKLGEPISCPLTTTTWSSRFPPRA